MNYVGMRARALRFGVAAVSLAAIACPASAQQMSDADAATAFGKRESVLDASLSPDGSKIATVVPGPGQGTVLAVIDVASGASTPIHFADGNPLALASCGRADRESVGCGKVGSVRVSLVGCGI